MKEQTIYLAIDDSGQLSLNNKVTCFGGLVLFNRHELITFTKDYQKIINQIKCHYCYHSCKHNCPELKHYNLRYKDIKKILKHLKRYYLIGCTINNALIYPKIMHNKKAKGRYLDYAIKRLVKDTIKNLINLNLIDPFKKLNIILYVDEHSYKSNGYYDLKNSIYEELKHGMSNIKNNVKFTNIITGSLKIKLYYANSKKNYLVEGADIVAGTIRQNYLQNKPPITNFLIKLP